MHIVAHRGLWLDPAECNAPSAFRRALDRGFGIETDVRDMAGQLVLSHEMPLPQHSVPLEELLTYYAHNKCTTPLALNIKADGLQESLASLLSRYHISNYFVFDMSIPDTLGYLRHAMPTFVRRSEFETHSALEQRARGIWVDELTVSWLTAPALCDLAAPGMPLAIVSAEIHGRDHMVQWHEISQASRRSPHAKEWILCTDWPEHAREYFR